MPLLLLLKTHVLLLSASFSSRNFSASFCSISAGMRACKNIHLPARQPKRKMASARIRKRVYIYTEYMRIPKNSIGELPIYLFLSTLRLAFFFLLPRRRFPRSRARATSSFCRQPLYIPTVSVAK